MTPNPSERPTLRKRVYRPLGFWRAVRIRRFLNRLTGGRVGIYSTMEHYSNAPAAKVIRYSQFDKTMKLHCPRCGWTGTAAEGDEDFSDVMDVSCPRCCKMLLVVSG